MLRPSKAKVLGEPALVTPQPIVQCQLHKAKTGNNVTFSPYCLYNRLKDEKSDECELERFTLINH